MLEPIKIIAFDADDTLWVNEPYFRDVENKFCTLLKEHMPKEKVSQELLKTEMRNLSLYGYGVKGFILSMIETVIRICDNKADNKLISNAIELGKELLQKPIELLDGVEAVLASLNGDYKLVLATKGDLLDQERKLLKSGLEKHFHHIEVMSDKKKEDYVKLLKHLECKPENFLMIGNSLKSDILPVLELGSYAIHVPYHTTWIHENIEVKIDNPKFFKITKISEVIEIIEK
jgi:putative hydrolase of the HAD superfamily